MSWIYEQSTGKLSSTESGYLSTGYSGAPAGKNNPAMQNVPNVGPIPVGRYLIGSPIDSPEHGPFALPLTPDAANQMFGRSGFLVHGDSIPHPGDASEGCIIQPRDARIFVWNSGDRELDVIEGPVVPSAADLDAVAAEQKLQGASGPEAT